MASRALTAMLHLAHLPLDDEQFVGPFLDPRLKGFVEVTQGGGRLPLLFLGLPQRLFGDRALQQIARLTREDVEQAQIALGRLVRMAPVGGDHAKQFARSRQQRRGLGRADAGAAKGVEVFCARDLIPGFEVGNDGAPPELQRLGAAAKGARAHPLPEAHGVGREVAVRQQVEFPGVAGRIALRTHPLHRAKLRAGDRHGRVNDLAVERVAILLADQGNTDAMQQVEIGKRLGRAARRFRSEAWLSSGSRSSMTAPGGMGVARST